jgi:DNA-binding transcriptional MerR regulator
MAKYSIKELAKLTRIKAHTIRICEKRHSIIEPQRTSTNIRFYSDLALKRIINLFLLNNHGYTISKIADMSPEDANSIGCPTKVLPLSMSLMFVCTPKMT